MLCVTTNLYFRMGVTSLGDDLFNPTLTPDGIKCGDNAVCVISSYPSLDVLC